MNHSHVHARARTKGVNLTVPKPTSKTQKARAA